MAVDYTTTAFLTDVRQRAMAPTSQSLYTDAQLVGVANAQFKGRVLESLLRMREEFWVTYTDTTIVAGTDAYAIPAAAVAGRLRDVVLVDSAGNEKDLPRLEPEILSESRYPPTGFKIRNNKVVLYPVPTSSSGDTLRMYYYARPPDLTLVANCALISSVATAAYTVSAVPSGWTTATSVDAVDSSPPGFETLGSVLTISSVVGSVITLSAAVTGLAAGDYLTPTGYTPIPPIPPEAHGLLAQATATEILRQMGDQNAYALAKQEYMEMETRFADIVTPRVDGESRKVNSDRLLWR